MMPCAWYTGTFALRTASMNDHQYPRSPRFCIGSPFNIHKQPFTMASAWIPLNQDGNDDVAKRRRSSIEDVEKGWFIETQAMWPGQKFMLAVEVSWCTTTKTSREARKRALVFPSLLSAVAHIPQISGFLAAEIAPVFREFRLSLLPRLSECPIWRCVGVGWCNSNDREG
jgi:hypothetical protein